MKAEERAKRMAGNLYGVLIDYYKEMPKVVVSFFAKEIRAAQHEAIERCADVALEYLKGRGLSAEATATVAQIVVEIRNLRCVRQIVVEEQLSGGDSIGE